MERKDGEDDDLECDKKKVGQYPRTFDTIYSFAMQCLNVEYIAFRLFK